MSIFKKKIYNISLIFKESSLPRLEAEILVSFLLNKTREFVLTHPETKITPGLYKKFKSLEIKRLNNWPIAYLTGQKEFYGLNFIVGSTVLIPRPETEMMVDKIIEHIKTTLNVKQTPYIIDIGTGSGAIIISVAQELKRLFPPLFKNTKFAATDISYTALNTAKKNAKNYKLGNKIKFYRGNLLDPLKLNHKKIKNYRLFITANLPYLTPKQIKESPSISREPRLALNGGSDGLKYYRELFKNLKTLHLPAYVLCEIDSKQSSKIKTAAKKIFLKTELKIYKDLTKKNRLLIMKNPG
ncbi:MAG: peptide chain release factor N(5)-glutamine methyltransferase [Patescibacteria group bacterium]|jgi:release factor glutamine methyltransferase